jgi:hypothetical protein
VGDIYKYYVAYRLTADERKRRGLPVSFELQVGTVRSDNYHLQL